MAEKTAVPALERALDILELVSRQGPLPFGTIADELKLPTASAARMLKVLCQRQYLTRSAVTGKYECGPAPKSLLPAASQVSRLRTAAHPLLEALHVKTENTTIIFHWNGTVWECIDKIQCENSMSMQVIGSVRVDIFDYPWGPFAYEELRDHGQLSQVYQQLPADLKERLEKAVDTFHRDGYIAVRGQYLRVTAPVLDAEGGLVAAVAVGAFTSDNDTRRIREWGGLVAATAQAISHKMAGSFSP